MKRSLTLLFVIAVFALTSFAQTSRAARAAKALNAVPPPSATCTYAFNHGSGVGAFNFCVSPDGNIVSFVSPSTVENVYAGDPFEGYGFCDFNTGVAYYDYADTDSGNWGASVTLSTSPLTIQRTTSDGLFTLTQKFANTPTERIIKITMTLKNNLSSVAKSTYLVRHMEVQPNQATANYDASADTPSAVQTNVTGVINYPASLAVPHFTTVENYPGINPCNASGEVSWPITGDYGIGTWQFVSLPKGGSKTVSVEYKRN